MRELITERTPGSGRIGPLGIGIEECVTGMISFNVGRINFVGSDVVFVVLRIGSKTDIPNKK